MCLEIGKGSWGVPRCPPEVLWKHRKATTGKDTLVYLWVLWEVTAGMIFTEKVCIYTLLDGALQEAYR